MTRLAHTLARTGRLTGLIAAGLLLVAVTVAPALATSTSSPAVAPPASTTQDFQPTRCADAWFKAASDPSVTTYRTVGACEIDRRLGTIDRLTSAIKDAPALTGDHRTALQAILDGSATGLRSLRQKIESDTTLAELRPDVRSIFTDYRVYALTTRQVWLVRAADAVDAAGAALGTTAGNLTTLIARAKADGRDVTSANTHLGAMQAAVARALADVNGVAAKVLPLTPAQWNRGTAGPVLRAAHDSIAGARAELRTAMAEARQVIAALAAG